MDVKAKAYIKHGNEWYKVGEKFTVEREDGERLVARSLVVETELSAEKHKEALAKEQADAEKAAEDSAKKEADDKAKADAAAKKKADDEAAKASKQADKKGK